MHYELVKVCGMRNPENIRAVESLRPNWMGFIFWPKSSRYVAECPTYLPRHCKRVGVFVDEDWEQVKRTAENYALDIIQLHGHESPDYIRCLHTVCCDSVSIIKAFNITNADGLAQTKPYEGLVNYFLFDTKGKSVGGNGEKFDWSVLSAYYGDTPFLLSGGIGPDDVEALHAFHHEKCIGIDLNSRFETSPGLKDIAALRRFLSQISH